MIDSILTNKLIEQRQWKDVALGITANMGGERVQSSGSKSKMADALDKCVDMEAEIDAQVDRLIAAKREVIATIEKLDSPISYTAIPCFDGLFSRLVKFCVYTAMTRNFEVRIFFIFLK